MSPRSQRKLLWYTSLAMMECHASGRGTTGKASANPNCLGGVSSAMRPKMLLGFDMTASRGRRFEYLGVSTLLPVQVNAALALNVKLPHYRNYPGGQAWGVSTREAGRGVLAVNRSGWLTDIPDTPP